MATCRLTGPATQALILVGEELGVTATTDIRGSRMQGTTCMGSIIRASIDSISIVTHRVVIIIGRPTD